MNSGDLFEDFENYPLSVWQKTIDVNLTGAFLLSREAGKLIKQTSKYGNMINISSIYGLVAPDHRIYENQPFKSLPFTSSIIDILGSTGSTGYTGYTGSIISSLQLPSLHHVILRSDIPKLSFVDFSFKLELKYNVKDELI